MTHVANNVSRSSFPSMAARCIAIWTTVMSARQSPVEATATTEFSLLRWRMKHRLPNWITSVVGRGMFCSCSVNTCCRFSQVSLMVLCYFNYQAASRSNDGFFIPFLVFVWRNDYKWFPLAFWGLFHPTGLRSPSLVAR